MRALVTGAAGFIGSHLCERLLADGHEVLAVDCLVPYYDLDQKRDNLTQFTWHQRCTYLRTDLRTADLDELCSGVDVVFHQAGQPGVRLSWSDGFADYTAHNVLATQRMLEAANRAGVGRFVYASSSSVYGDLDDFPTDESTLPRPFSPYGVTKLAAEHLCSLYAANWGLPTVALRYFTVYGPRQRPDMAMHRLIEAAIAGTPFPLYGTGEQRRDFTFVDDIVAANLAAGTGDPPPGTVVNVAGAGDVTMNEVIATIGEIIGRLVPVDRQPAQPGDVQRTGGAIERAGRLLGWAPRTQLAEGLRRQIQWHLEHGPSVRRGRSAAVEPVGASIARWTGAEPLRGGLSTAAP